MAAVGTMATVQTGPYIMSKGLNTKDNNNDTTSKLINDIFSDLNSKDLHNMFSDFPLKFLPREVLEKLVNIELLFLMIIFNIFFVNIITKINYDKYLPNNKLGKLIRAIISRYINI